MGQPGLRVRDGEWRPKLGSSKGMMRLLYKLGKRRSKANVYCYYLFNLFIRERACPFLERINGVIYASEQRSQQLPSVFE